MLEMWRTGSHSSVPQESCQRARAHGNVPWQDSPWGQRATMKDQEICTGKFKGWPWGQRVCAGRMLETEEQVLRSEDGLWGKTKTRDPSQGVCAKGQRTTFNMGAGSRALPREQQPSQAQTGAQPMLLRRRPACDLPLLCYFCTAPRNQAPQFSCEFPLTLTIN